MNTRFLHILAQITCTAYTLGNIYYALNDHAVWSCVGSTVSVRWYYWPTGAMQFAMIWLAWDAAAKESPIIKVNWKFFLVLAFGQLVDFFISNPMVETWSNWAFGGLAIIVWIRDLRKINKSSRTGL